jgi:16S rRNA (uracil1498-N3)-methyltransferase
VSPYLFVPGPWEGDLATTAEQAHHLLKVLRMTPPFAVHYGDGQGARGQGTFTGEVILRGPEQLLSRTPPVLTMAVAPPDDRTRQRLMVEKLSELGCARLSWLTTRRTVGRPPGASKSGAWAASAFEQSRGTWLMEVGAPVAVADLPAGTWFAVPGAERAVLPPPAELVVAIGPEGGWADGEVPEGATTFGLGEGILRTETAAIAAAAFLRIAR